MSYEILGTQTPDNLIAGHEAPLMTKLVTLLAGEGELARGAILGKVTLGAVTKAAAGAGAAGANTGNGTLTVDATTPLLANAQVGVYKVDIIQAAVADPAAAAVARITDPVGNVIGDIEVATTPGTTFETQVKFVIVEGTTPFVVGDGFTLTVAAGSGKHKLVDATALDGSAVADAILCDAVTVATNADSKAVAYKTGIFNRDALSVAENDTVAAHEEELRARGIFLRDEY